MNDLPIEVKINIIKYVIQNEDTEGLDKIRLLNKEFYNSTYIYNNTIKNLIKENVFMKNGFKYVKKIENPEYVYKQLKKIQPDISKFLTMTYPNKRKYFLSKEIIDFLLLNASQLYILVIVENWNDSRLNNMFDEFLNNPGWSMYLNITKNYFNKYANKHIKFKFVHPIDISIHDFNNYDGMMIFINNNQDIIWLKNLHDAIINLSKYIPLIDDLGSLLIQN